MTVGLSDEGVSIGRWPLIKKSSSQDRFRAFEGRKDGRNVTPEVLDLDRKRRIYK
jgi:hypothetical protein